MALDPSIALQVKPFQLPDPAESAGKVLQLKNLMQQQRLGAQQEQSGALDLQQKQLAVSSQAAIRQAYIESKGDIDKTLQRGAELGALPKDLQAMKASQLELQQHMANLDKTQAENAKSHGEATASEASGLLDIADPQKRAAAFPGAVQRLVSSGNVKPQEAQAMLSGAAADPNFLSDDNLKMMVAHGTLYKDQADIALKKRTVKTEEDSAAARKLTAETGATKEGAELPGQQADARSKQRVELGSQLGAATTPDAYNAVLNAAPHGIAQAFPTADKVFDQSGKMIPGGQSIVRQVAMTPEQQAQAGQAKDNAAALLAHNKEDERQGAGRLKVSQREQDIRDKTFNATLGAGLDANGRPLSSDEARTAAMGDPVARAIANYQTPPPSSRTSALGMAVMRKVLAIDPNYDATKFPERTKITQDFSASGASGKAMTSTDTALSHLHVLSQAGDAMKTGDIPALNKLAQFLGAQTGQSPKVTYDSIVAMVAPEISKAVIGAAGGEADRKTMAANFSSSNSDAQREGSIGITAKLLGARFEKQGQAYESDMGKPLGRKLSPESQKVLDRYSGKGDAAPVAYSKTATGPNGHKIGSNDGQSWFDVKTGQAVK